MPEPASFPAIMYLAVALTTVALPAASPDASLSLWRAMTGFPERLRERRRARLSRELDGRMKKYWVIDMRDLR